jgi:hypothetical protein
MGSTRQLSYMMELSGKNALSLSSSNPAAPFRERYANPMLYVVCVAKLCRPLRRAA